MIKKTKYRFLFAGGGTGGHLFPAVAVAEKIRAIIPEAEILFVGTKSKIEGRVVPKLGFKFNPIWIKGFSRRMTIDNLLFPVKLFVSVIQSIFISIKFKPKVAIGSGGYVSGPAVYGAKFMGAKVLLIEQNSYPGVTTRLLERYADEVHISFDNSRKYLKHPEKVFFTGNPVRESLTSLDKENGLKKFDLSSSKNTLLVLGGSLGARSINEAVAGSIKQIEKTNIQVIWQTGKNYYEKYKIYSSDNVKVFAFIEDMNSAYAACDLLVARAGATTIAELLVLGIPSILVPSPNVAENHQYYNAKSLADNNAALMIEDEFVKEKLFELIVSTIPDQKKLNDLKNNAVELSKPAAAEVIAKRAIKYAEEL